MKLDGILDKVNSKQTFLDFVGALRDDKIDEDEKEKIKKSNPYEPGANGWQNVTIEAFLDAIHSYGQDSAEINEEPNWRMFALLLMADKMYE